jgi:hypothetical protein
MRITQAHIRQLVMEELQLLNEVSLEKAKESLDSKKLLKAIKQYAINYAHGDPWEWQDVFQDDGSYVFGTKPTERALRPQALNNMVSTMHKSLKGWIWDMIPEDIETDRTRRDKSNQALALLWLLRLIRTQPSMMKKVVHDYAEDSEKIMEDFEMYFNYKHLMEKPDLNSIKSTDELAQVVLNARDAIKDYQEKQSYANAEEGTEVFRDDDELKIYAIHNKGAACELGKGTDWCTAAPGLDYFAEYYEEDDPLFYFDALLPGKDYSGETARARFQFHYGSRQFMDEDDHPVSGHTEDILHSALMQTDAPAKYSVLRKHDRGLKLGNPGTSRETLEGLVDNPELTYNDLHRVAQHPNASEEILRKLMHASVRSRDYMGAMTLHPLAAVHGDGGVKDYGVSLKAVLAQRETSPEFLEELWEITWKRYQEELEKTAASLRKSPYNEERPDWYASVSPRQFHRIKEFFMPVWKKIAWNPTVATSTLEEIIEKAEPSDYVKELIKQKILAREAGEEELDFVELRRRVTQPGRNSSDEDLSRQRGAAMQAFHSGENISESKVFARWQKIIK